MSVIQWSPRPDPQVATITLSTGERRSYRCDPIGHRVIVTDERGVVHFAFGARGSHPGAFESPLDVALVTPTFDGDQTALPEDAWLAVADYGNARVQIFDLDGSLVDVLSGDDLDYGWRPCRLSWRAPFLQIEGVEGGGCCVHLAAALLAHCADGALPKAGPLMVRRRSSGEELH
jgi:hypothetical protein